MKKYIAPALRVTTVLGLLFIIWSQHNQIKVLKTEDRMLEVKYQYDSLKSECDSLRGELLVKDIDLGRYHMVLDNLEIELPIECKETLNKILSQIE